MLDESLLLSAGLVVDETGLGTGPVAGPVRPESRARKNADQHLIELAAPQRPDWEADMLEHMEMDMLLDDLRLVVYEYEKYRSDRWLGSACKYWSDTELQDEIEKSNIPIGRWLREATAAIFAFHGIYFIEVAREHASERWIWAREEDWMNG